MKQKFILTAALVSALAFTACVDETESASVTKVREAKAEQLLAQANLLNAQAEAAKITANAEAQLAAAQQAAAEAAKAKDEAEAKIKEAEARAKNAEAEAQEIKNRIAAAQEDLEYRIALAQAERDIAEAEAAKARAEAKKAEAENRLKAAEEAMNRIADEAYLAILDLQKKIAEAEAALAEELEKIDAKAQEALVDASAAYQSAVEALLQLQTEYNEKSTLLARANAGVLDKDEAIDAVAAEIASLEAALKVYEEYLGQGTTDATELRAKVVELMTVKNALWNEYKAAYDVYSEAKTAKRKAVKKYDEAEEAYNGQVWQTKDENGNEIPEAAQPWINIKAEDGTYAKALASYKLMEQGETWIAVTDSINKLNKSKAFQYVYNEKYTNKAGDLVNSKFKDAIPDNDAKKLVTFEKGAFTWAVPADFVSPSSQEKALAEMIHEEKAAEAQAKLDKADADIKLVEKFMGTAATEKMWSVMTEEGDEYKYKLNNLIERSKYIEGNDISAASLTLTDSLASAQAYKDAAEEEYATANEAFWTALKTLREAKKAYSDAKEDLPSSVVEEEDDLNDLFETYQGKVKAFVEAKAKLATAEEKLTAAKKNDTKAEEDAVKAAKKAVADAKKALEDLQTAAAKEDWKWTETEGETVGTIDAMEKAIADVPAAEVDLMAAEAALAKVQDVSALEADVENAQKDLDDAEEAMTAAEEAYTEAAELFYGEMAALTEELEALKADVILSRKEVKEIHKARKEAGKQVTTQTAAVTALRELKKEILRQTNENGGDLVTTKADAQTALDNLEIDYDLYKTIADLKAEVAALCAGINKPVPSAENLAKAQAAVDAAELVMDSLKVVMDSALVVKEAAIATFKEAKAEMTEAKTAFKEAEAEIAILDLLLNGNVNTYNYSAHYNGWIDGNHADVDLNWTEVSVNGDKADKKGNIQNNYKNLTKEIEALKSMIADKKQQYKDLTNNFTQEDLVAQYEAELEVLAFQIKMAEVEVARAAAALKALTDEYNEVIDGVDNDEQPATPNGEDTPDDTYGGNASDEDSYNAEDGEPGEDTPDDTYGGNDPDSDNHGVGDAE